MISVKALGDGDDYLDSTYSNEVNFKHKIKLDSPVISLAGKIVSWISVQNAEGYVVVINGVEYEETTNSFDISDYANKDLKISVKAKGNGVEYLDSDSSNEVNYIITYTLSKPTIRADKNTISWDAIDNAASYIVYVNDDFITTETNSYTLDAMVFGSFEVSVKAVGDNYRYFDSEISNKLQISIGIKLDGLLDDEQWVCNGYSYYAAEADNTVEVETISYLHQKGIYLGFIVNDLNAEIISSLPNENHGSGISFFISDGPLNTKTSHMLRIFMDGYYRCARYEGTRWYGVQNDYFLDIEVATTITEEGYIIEAYFPFSSLGMENGTEDIYVFSGTFVKKADGTFAERYGLVNTYSSKIGDVINYFHFDQNGFVPNEIYFDNIVLENDDLVDGYFVKEFEIYSSENKFNKLAGVTFASDYFSEIGNGVYKLSIPVSEIESFVESQDFLLTYEDLEASLTVQYLEMDLDGILDEDQWGENTYSTKNTASNVSQTIYSYLGNAGLYLGIEVFDSNVVVEGNKSHLEVFLNLGEELGIGNSWQLRFYASGTVRTYVYKTPGSDGWAWTETPVNLNSKIVLTETGWIIEAYFPYKSLNVTEKLVSFDLLSYLGFVKEGATNVTILDGDKSVNNAYNTNLDNYVSFNSNGFVPKGIYFDSIVLGNKDLVDGEYVKEFEIYSSDNRLSKLIGASFTSEYFLEIGNGLYRLTIPASEITSFLETQEFLVSYEALEASISVQYIEMNLDGILDEEEWASSTYSTKNTASNVTQTIHSYLGNTGLYLGIIVLDSNVVSDTDKTHLEVFLNIGEELGIGNTWQFRFYASGSLKTYVYITPSSDGWAWTEVTGESKLNITANISLTENGWVVEAYLPYTTLNMTEKPADFDLLSLMCFVEAGETSVNVYDGDNKSNNFYVINYNNYLKFNLGGYIEE